MDRSTGGCDGFSPLQHGDGENDLPCLHQILAVIEREGRFAQQDDPSLKRRPGMADSAITISRSFV
jgi:hypothetical protein